MSVPIGSYDNNYIIHEKLGEGGMGEVYRATHRSTGRVVALKRIRASVLTEDSLRSSIAQKKGSRYSNDLRLSLAEEFQTLASLHHPYIVSVLDYGFDEQHEPFFTMELLCSPQTILEWAQGQSILAKAELLVQLLQALSYLHRRSILHRDIKPSNVLVEDGKAKLLDFGIAHAMGGATTLAGTIEYMAPELFLGKSASPASDLYAVGVLASELFNSRLPHSTSSLTDFLDGVLGDAAQLTLDPSAMELISARNFGSKPRHQVELSQSSEPTLPPSKQDSTGPVSFIINRLLDRSPENRYQDANQVILDLSKALSLDLFIETAETRESFLQAATFVGREHELAQLLSMLKAAERGTGGIVLVSGESGVGKSRLLKELRTQALVRSARVIHSQSHTSQGGSHHLWSSVLRELCLYTDHVSALDIGILKDLVPDIEALLRRPAEKSPPAQPQVAQTRLRNTIEKLFRFQKKLVLILLEDLQWATTESLELLKFLRQIVQTVPVLIVGNYREDEATEEIHELHINPVIKLKRLDNVQISQLCESILGEPGKDPTLVAYLQRQTEGNVFFLIEVLRALAENAGQLGLVGEQPLPEQLLTGGIQRLVERRLAKLSPKQQSLLRLAAIAGRQVDEQVLSLASGQQDLTSWLTVCANASVLERQSGTWIFAHDKVRDCLLTNLDPLQEKQLHRLVAESITEIYPNNSSYDSILAYHWNLVGDYKKTYLYSVKSAQLSARLYALRETRAHLNKALEALEKLPNSEEKRRSQVDTMLLKMGASQISDTLADYINQTEITESILDTFPQQGDNYKADQTRRSRVYFLRARGYFVNSQPKNALIWYYSSMKIASLCNEEMQIAVLSGAVAATLLCQGHMKKCQFHFQNAIDFFHRQNMLIEEGRLIGCLGSAQIGSGQLTEGLDSLHQGESRLSTERAFLVTALGFLVAGSFFLQDWAGVRRVLLNSISQKIVNDELLECFVYWFLAWAESHLGSPTVAQQYREQAASIFRRRQSVANYDWLLVGDAEMALHSGDPELAIQNAQKAIRIASDMDGILALGLAHRVWAQALAAQNPPNWDSAEEHLAESVKFLESGEIWLLVAHTRMIWGEVACSRGEKANAIVQYKIAEKLFELSRQENLLIKCQQEIKSCMGHI